MSCFDEKENNDYFLLFGLKQVNSTSIIVVFSWPYEESFRGDFCGNSVIKILLSITLGHPQKFKGCDSSLEDKVVSGLACSSLLMVEWSLITVLVTCALYQLIVLQFFFFFFNLRDENQKEMRNHRHWEKGKPNRLAYIPAWLM